MSKTQTTKAVPNVEYVALPMRNRYAQFAEVRVNGSDVIGLYPSVEGRDFVDIVFMVRDADYSDLNSPTSSEFVGVTVRPSRVADVVSKLALIHA